VCACMCEYIGCVNLHACMCACVREPACVCACVQNACMQIQDTHVRCRACPPHTNTTPPSSSQRRTWRALRQGRQLIQQALQPLHRLQALRDGAAHSYAASARRCARCPSSTTPWVGGHSVLVLVVVVALERCDVPELRKWLLLQPGLWCCGGARRCRAPSLPQERLHSSSEMNEV